MDVNATLEFDGFLAYTVKVTALADLDLKDIVMHIPFEKKAAVYMMGLSQKGGYRPDSMYRWKWDVAHRNQDGAWIGRSMPGCNIPSGTNTIPGRSIRTSICRNPYWRPPPGPMPARAASISG
jgi:hypothetical protein